MSAMNIGMKKGDILPTPRSYRHRVVPRKLFEAADAAADDDAHAIGVHPVRAVGETGVLSLPDAAPATAVLGVLVSLASLPSAILLLVWFAPQIVCKVL